MFLIRKLLRTRTSHSFRPQLTQVSIFPFFQPFSSHQSWHLRPQKRKMTRLPPTLHQTFSMVWFSWRSAVSWTVSRQAGKNLAVRVLNKEQVTLRARHEANGRFLYLFLHQFLDDSFNFSILVALDLKGGSFELQEVFFLGLLLLVIYWAGLLFHCWQILWIVSRHKHFNFREVLAETA